jgi:hypothetical protein
MKKIKWLISGFVVLSMLCFFTVSMASAQAFDNKWLKLNCQLKSYEVDPVTGDFERLNARFTAYLYLTFIEVNVDGSRTYTWDIWTETAPGVWTNSYSTQASSIIANENFFSDRYLRFNGEGGVFIDVYVTAFINNTRFNTSLKATGEVYYGESDLGNEIYGSISINGTSTSRLPFTPGP